MNKKIMFSPVGGTDPISEVNCRDGSLLHIFRVYKPDEVYLYMSKDIISNHELDNRYIYCLDQIAKLQNRSYEYHIIERRDLVNVQNYDFFYKDFRNVLEDIRSKMDETDELILNVSSGTPAMKSCLVMLWSITDIGGTAVQVATPERGMNEHKHRNEDIEMLWSLNDDNLEDFENRCTEVETPALMIIQNRELIKRHLDVYDYRAALRVAKLLPSSETEKYLSLLEMAEKRYLLDGAGFDRIMKQDNRYVLPVRSGDERKLVEYGLLLEIKNKKGEYGDFIRSITPLFVDLFRLVLKKQCGINISDYCSFDRRGAECYDRGKLKGTEIDSILSERYNEFKYGPLNSDSLVVLLEKKLSNVAVAELVRNLRNVETGIRNMAAHQIVSITDERIKNLTGYTADQIMKMIRQVYSHTGINVKKETWDSYDEMNQVILQEMGY